ncbi:uncharacterized protein LOC127795687 isoform X2 [Diospyros lotus]|uniref:uncharacterized protein LOC127795687 isoform X2 n=1 Tax=Diospyros lotus TaxID=55363 RepID=UPI002259783C|nr:uncharacterized protein LOC127795687 isoform X2 [Diospyros lotus]
MPMGLSLIVLLAILPHLLVPSESKASGPRIGSETTSCGDHQNHQLIAEFEEAKLRIDQLESLLEGTIWDINAKSFYLKENEKLIKEMTHELDRLQSAFSSLQDESLSANRRLNQLEEEVRILWATLGKNNFELHLLASKAEAAENRLELVTSQVEKMADIVTEQWIQIQQLEQALHIAEMRALKVKREVSFTRCTFLKFVRNLFGNHLRKLMMMLDSLLFDKESALGSYASQALQKSKRIMSATKKYHHELQGWIKQEMERNELTAALANEELVFFMASALIIFPVMGVWILLSSQFS